MKKNQSNRASDKSHTAETTAQPQPVNHTDNPRLAAWRKLGHVSNGAAIDLESAIWRAMAALEVFAKDLGERIENEDRKPRSESVSAGIQDIAFSTGNELQEAFNSFFKSVGEERELASELFAVAGQGSCRPIATGE
ncbi:MAG: hypothetical protein U1G07_12440 [Verrucomicrobiota bacterium]